MSPNLHATVDQIHRSYDRIPEGSPEQGTPKYKCHFTLRSYLRRVAEELELAPTKYKVRSNFGGPGVAGEVMLHYEDFYVMLHNDFHGKGIMALYRTCNGLTDYTGGPNQYCTLRELPAKLAQLMRSNA